MFNTLSRMRIKHHRTLVAGACGLVIGVIIASGFNWTAGSRAEKGGAAVLPNASAPLSNGTVSPFAAVAKAVGPAVVNIRTKKVIESPGTENFGPFEDFFKDFFRDQQRQPQRQKVEGQGSGFVIRKDGYILTNNHVVADGSELIVRLSDNREFRAEVVGKDPSSDVAVIKLKNLASDLTDSEVACLGNSDEIEVGDYAIAIGNPFGLERTVTQGIISFKGRSGLPISGGGPLYQDFIQTDASINFGNSGGPLVNIRGQVIGINTAINPAGQGIGFAIPINMARSIAVQLIESGKVVRAYLGVLPQEVTPELADGMGLKEASGIRVAKVEDDTPASRAGLKEDDVIIRFDGREVGAVAKFRQIVAESEVGAKVEIVLIRDGREKKLSAVLDEKPDQAAARPKEDKTQKPWLGIIRVAAADSPEARAAGIEDKSGVMIREIEPGSAAADAGLRQGDLIKKIGSREVKNVDDYNKAQKAGKSEASVVFKVKRGQFVQFIDVKQSQ